MNVTELEGFKVHISKGKCLVNPENITIEAWSTEELNSIIEVLAMILPPLKANYTKEWRCVTLREFEKLISIYSSGKITFCAKDLEEAKLILNYVKFLIEKAKKEYMENGPPEEKELELKKKLTVLELYKYLPKTNCGLCGQPTCIALADKILRGEASLNDCKPLKDPKNMYLIEKLRERFGERILKSLGWY